MANRKTRIVAAPVSSKSSARVIRNPKAQRAALASVTPVVVDPASPVVDIDAKRSDAAKRAAETRRVNAALRSAAEKRAADAARLSDIAKRAAATRAANRAAGIAPRATNEAPANRSDAATKANRTRLVQKLAAATDPAVKADLAAKLAAFDARHAPAAPAIVVEVSPEVATEVAKQNWFNRFFSFLMS